MLTHWSVAQVDSNKDKNWRSKILLDYPFKEPDHRAGRSSLPGPGGADQPGAAGELYHPHCQEHLRRLQGALRTQPGPQQHRLRRPGGGRWVTTKPVPGLPEL